jgi:hypothetical protein
LQSDIHSIDPPYCLIEVLQNAESHFCSRETDVSDMPIRGLQQQTCAGVFNYSAPVIEVESLTDDLRIAAIRIPCGKLLEPSARLSGKVQCHGGGGRFSDTWLQAARRKCVNLYGFTPQVIERQSIGHPMLL